MGDLTERQASLSTKLVGNDEQYAAYVDSNGRLSVNANITFPEALYSSPLFVNGTNDNMAVNGATTNVVFSASIGSTVKYVESISYVIEDNADFGLSGFGAGAALTNGLQLSVQSKGVVQNMAFFRNNYSIFMFFDENPMVDLKSGILGNSRAVIGSHKFQQRIALDPNLGDYIRFTVRDNQSALTRFSARVTLWSLNG